MTRQANILSFDEVKAREASLPRTVSPSSSSRRAYEAHRNAEEGAARRTSSRSNTPRVSSARSYREASASRFAESDYAQLQRPSRERASMRGYDDLNHAAPRAGRGYSSSVSAGDRRYSSARAQARRGYQPQVFSGYASSRSDAARGVRSRRIDDASAESEERAAARRSAQRKQNEIFSQEIRKRFRAAKADREFDRTIGARERARARAEQQEQGSRAAVYDMRMGSTQRKSVRSMAEGESDKHGFSLPFAIPFSGSISAWATRGIVSLIAVVFAVTMLYFPCQNYYNETRQLQQLQAEYDALQEYNTQMQNQVDYLNTDEGIEDYARSELGWIRPGEHVVSVEGVTPSTSDSRSNDRVYAIPAGSVAAPDTWYSGILDVIFGYGH